MPRPRDGFNRARIERRATGRAAPHSVPKYGESLLAQKLSSLVDLPACAELELGKLETVYHPIGRGTDLIVQGRPHSDLCILVKGSAIRYKVFPDGRRQIVNFILPGDIIGLRALLCPIAFNSVTTLEASVVAPFQSEQIFNLFGRFPEVAGALFWLSTFEQMLISERFVSVGRGNAYERLGFLFLELWERLCLVDLNQGPSFWLPLTYDILADALGLSSVHVGRTLNLLRDERLVRFDRGRVTLPDPDRLASKCDFQTGYILGFTSHSIGFAFKRGV